MTEMTITDYFKIIEDKNKLLTKEDQQNIIKNIKESLITKLDTITNTPYHPVLNNQVNNIDLYFRIPVDSIQKNPVTKKEDHLFIDYDITTRSIPRSKLKEFFTICYNFETIKHKKKSYNDAIYLFFNNFYILLCFTKSNTDDVYFD